MCSRARGALTSTSVRGVNPTTWLDGLPAGSRADWFAAVGTVAAFFIALVVYMQSRKDAKRSQARLVHAYLLDHRSVVKGDEPDFPAPAAVFVVGGGGEHFEHTFPDDGPKAEVFRANETLHVLVVKVENNSDEIVTQLVPRLFLAPRDGDAEEIELSDVPFLAPHSSAQRYATFGVGTLPIGEHRAAVSFVDSSGRRWYRDQLRPLRRAWRRPKSEWDSASRDQPPGKRLQNESRDHLA